MLKTKDQLEEQSQNKPISGRLDPGWENDPSWQTNTGGDKAANPQNRTWLGGRARREERVGRVARVAKMPKKVKQSHSCPLESAI
jgi:hypothetical protein